MVWIRWWWSMLPTYLLAMTATYLYVLFYWPDNDSVTYYVPKSQRWKRWA